MNNEEKEIAFTEDIADLVAQELGMPREKILHHMGFFSHWVKHLTKLPTVLTVYMPKLGTLFLNWSKVKSEVEYFGKIPEAELSTQWANRLRVNRERLEEFKRVFGDYNGYIRHKKRQKIFNPYYTKGKTLKELEQWQNNQA